MVQVEKQTVYLCMASACAVAGAVLDVRSRRIPNFITLPALLIGLQTHLIVDGWKGLFSSLGAGLLCGGIFLIFYLAGGMGAGDVKLMAAAGALAGLSHSAYLLVLTSLAGGAMAIAFAMMRGRLKETFQNLGSLAVHHRDAGLTPHPELNVANGSTLRLPYGLAIAAGCCATLYFRAVGA